MKFVFRYALISTGLLFSNACLGAENYPSPTQLYEAGVGFFAEAERLPALYARARYDVAKLFLTACGEMHIRAQYYLGLVHDRLAVCKEAVGESATENIALMSMHFAQANALFWRKYAEVFRLLGCKSGRDFLKHADDMEDDVIVALEDPELQADFFLLHGTLDERP